MKDTIDIRASSWGELFDCALRWESKYIRGMTVPATGAAHLGTSVHHGTQVFDQHKLNGYSVSIDYAEEEFIDTLRNPQEEVRYTRNDLKPHHAEIIGRKLVRKYCGEVSPKLSYRAVEVRPEPLEVDAEGVTIRLTGQLDRLRVLHRGEGLGIADIKTGTNAVNARGQVEVKKHAFQLGVYELLAEYSLNEQINKPAAIIGMQTNTKARIGIGHVDRPRRGLIGSADSPGLIQMAARMLKEGVFPPNPSSILCSERYCPNWAFCSYRG